MNKVVILPYASTLVTLTEAGITSLVKVLRKLERPAKTKPEDRRPTRKKKKKKMEICEFYSFVNVCVFDFRNLYAVTKTSHQGLKQKRIRNRCKYVISPVLSTFPPHHVFHCT